MLTQIEPYLVSFLIGLLIGIDRERSLPQGLKGMGVRTFILIALIGTIVREVDERIFTFLISSFVLGAVLAHYLLVKRKEADTIGLTTGLAASAVYCLGYITPIKPGLAATIGAAILVILVGREWLHTFAKEKLRPNEIRAAATMVVILLCVLVFLPNSTIDPWGIFNPRIYGILVATIAGLQFVGYVAIRVFGERLGVIFMGFFGGLVSSTAVFATLPKFVNKHANRIRPAAAAGILATVGMLIEFTIIMFIASPELLLSVFPIVLAMTITGILGAALMFPRPSHEPHTSPDPPSNPLDLKAVLYLSTLIAGMLIAVTMAKQFVGTQGAQLVTFLGALFELHSVSIATATLYTSGKLSLIEARHSLLFALLASYVTKFILVWALARRRFAIIMSALLALMVAAGISILLIHLPKLPT